MITRLVVEMCLWALLQGSAWLWPAAVALRGCQSQTALTSFGCDFYKTHPRWHMPDTGVHVTPAGEVKKIFLFQFNTLSHLVENNCPKSGVQEHQISSLCNSYCIFMGLQLLCPDTEQLFCWVKIRWLTWQLNGPSGGHLVVNPQYLYPCRHVSTAILTMTQFARERILIWLCFSVPELTKTDYLKG